MNEGNNPLLEIKGVRKVFPLRAGFFAGRQGFVHALNGVSLKIFAGETMGLVGESGCGKSTLGRLVVRLDEPTEGEILFEGNNIMHLDKKELRRYRRQVQIVFQDPYASLNPRQRVGDIIAEPLIVHRMATIKAARKEAEALMEKVGLSLMHARRYPHEFSGGQRQRIGIARALALRPKVVIADEPVSALDVSVQAQILNLLKDLQQEFHLTYLFISHDLRVVRFMSNRVAVMYYGKIVELANRNELFENPLHPYTRALLASSYMGKDRKKEVYLLDDELPDPLNLPAGCAFYPRCPRRMEICRKEEPLLTDRGNHLLACHL